jgi:hypothetical protein
VSVLLRVIVLVLVAAAGAQAQALNSGSNGSDGALNLTTPGELIFNPVALGLDADRDNVFHFTTITIGPGVTVKMPFSQLQGLPVVWLAQGAVLIEGIIDLNGQAGAAASPGALNRASVPGPGGYPGGVGSGGPGFIGVDLRLGLGPGGAGVSHQAGHADPGPDFGTGGVTGAAYGNALLVPLRGGSGGGGGGDNTSAGGGGGAGGGALRIFSSTSIAVNGSITADGGNGGAPPSGQSTGAGGGSGGSIHLIAPTISGTGTLSALGGGHGNLLALVASRGRIRLDATANQFAGTANALATNGAPYNVPLPAGMPLVRVTGIGGIAVSTTPTGDSATPDATINQSGPVTVAIEGRNVPVGTVVQVRVMSGAVPDFVVDSTPLAGTLDSSTATAEVTFPPGFSRGFIRATWSPPVP